MPSSKCLKTNFHECTRSAQTSVGIPHSLLVSREQVCMQKLGNVQHLLVTTSTAVHTEWQAAAVHTEEQCGPNSGPPHPCPSDSAELCWRCCPQIRGGCRSCCLARSSGSVRENPASRGRLSSLLGWAAAAGQTQASWVSPEGWWGREDLAQGSVERGLYADEGLDRGWRGQGVEECPECPVCLNNEPDNSKKRVRVLTAWAP